MFFDDEGDLAHEFYEEVFVGGHSRMKRLYKNLTPQVGEYKISVHGSLEMKFLIYVKWQYLLALDHQYYKIFFKCFNVLS